MDRQNLCKTSIFIITPEYQSSASSCQNFNNQGEISFEKNGCGIIIESSTWWKQTILNVTGKTDGVINKRDREVYIKLGTLRTQNPADISGVWYNFTMPDIKVSSSKTIFMNCTKHLIDDKYKTLSCLSYFFSPLVCVYFLPTCFIDIFGMKVKTMEKYGE